MTNILPPELKQQIQYSKRNVVVFRYLIVFSLIAATVGGALFVSHRYAAAQIAEYEEALKEADAEIAAYGELESSVAILNEQLQTIDAIISQRPQFSVLLEDIATVLPTGSFINGISLSEDIDQPLQLTITAASRGQAIIVRDAIIQSPKIESADIQTINPIADSGRVNVDIIIAFNDQEAL